ncbi:hypothetical protein NDN08_007509 [Rhodosorus marinus]|uniref:Glycine cleavage system H protein n=1 Tax=Rhodosorus marinus TaxID=101924 RepID=A0AAV8V1C3_9RHOD|nr:hypothetical protein NDN08_007509 [Rhodosorus marinus]
MLGRLSRCAGLVQGASMTMTRGGLRQTAPTLTRFMSTYPGDRRYADTHEWLKKEDGTVTVGITAHAAEKLGDIVYVSLPEVGESFAKNDAMGVIESVKAASDLVCPVNGKIEEVNSTLADSPELVNKEPHEQGWFVKMKLDDDADFEALYDTDGYQKFVDSEED